MRAANKKALLEEEDKKREEENKRKEQAKKEMLKDRPGTILEIASVESEGEDEG